jgi:prophage DNA circulation protein
MLIDTDGTVAAALGTLRRQLSELIVTCASMDRKMGVIMSEDAGIEAVVTDIAAQVTNLTAAMQSVSATLATALAEAATNGNTVSPQTITDLQNAQIQLDTAVSAAQAQASTEASSVTPPPAAPPTA